jgi:probable HAF family extracellular repeat protein
MSRNRSAAVLVGLLAGVGGCDSGPTEQPTDPEAASSASPAATTVYYTATYIAQSNGAAQDVNNKGQVVGWYGVGNATRAFIWEKGVRKDLVSLGGSNSAAYAINDAGQVVGESELADQTEMHAVLWSNGAIKDLGTLGFTGAVFTQTSQALGINATGQAVGWAFTKAMTKRAFIYQGGTMKRLTGMEGTTAQALAIDSVGRIVGFLGQSTAPRAFRWQAGVLTKLPGLGGSTSWANAINNTGKIVGWSTTAAGATRAVLWQNGAATNLGTLGADWSVATAINKSGQITGSSATADGQGHAFVWKNGVMSEAPLRGDPVGMNDAGWIVGRGSNPLITGGPIPTVWQPTTTPPPPPPPGFASLGSTAFISNRNLSINPAVDTIPVGTTMTWTWLTGATHNVQSTGTPSFPSSALLTKEGAKYTHTFTKAGTYRYGCVRHPQMTGRVIVR